MDLKSKPVSASAIENQVHHIFPKHMNMLGTIFGGYILSWADELAGLTALSHLGGRCLMISMESHFLGRIENGYHLIMAASVNRTWDTSLEVGVKGWAQDPLQTHLRSHIFSAYCVLVGLDENMRVTSVPEVIPETDEQKRRFEDAGQRRAIRLAQLKK